MSHSRIRNSAAKPPQVGHVEIHRWLPTLASPHGSNNYRGDATFAVRPTIELWRDPDAPGGIGVWVAKGLPVLEAVIDRGSIATLPMVAFWLRDREHALAIEAQVAGSTH
jgi:hypothetical protein